MDFVGNGKRKTKNAKKKKKRKGMDILREKKVIS